VGERIRGFPLGEKGVGVGVGGVEAVTSSKVVLLETLSIESLYFL